MTTRRSSPRVVVVAAVLAAAGCRTEKAADEPDAASKSVDSSHAFALHGSLSTRYRGRFGGGDQDHDAYSVLSIAAGDAARDPWNAYVLAEGAADLDGREDRSSPSYSLADTHDGAVDGRLYEAYVDNHSLDALSTVRLGRQIDYQTPAIVTFDGLKVASRELGPDRVTLGAYGGIPAHLESGSTSGDRVFGAFVEARAWKGNSARLDWMHLDDEALLGRHGNDLLELALGQSIDEHWRFDGRYSRLEAEDRDASLRATYADAEHALDLQASWYRLLRAQNERALDLDPFTSVLLEQAPYTEWRLVASKGFGSAARLQIGADLRRVSDSGDVAEFNRDFDRWFATLSSDDLLPAGIALSLTGEVWDGDSDDVRTWGLDLARDLGERFRVSLGSYYALYKYDLFLVQERDDVRTYYFRLRYKGKSAWSWDVRYEFEDSFASYSSLRLGATWRF